jgi:LytS/YehU family sensor histidine kinase
MVIAGGSFLFQMLMQAQRRRKLKPFVSFPAMLALILLVWFISLRISSGLLSPSLAWDKKWINFAIIIAYFLANYRFEKWQIQDHELLSKMDNALSIKEMELEFMKTQLNPHFLFNSLNNVAATIMVNRDLALEYTYKLSEMLRYQVGISGCESVGIVEEDTFIRNYLDVEKLRLGERCNVEYISQIQTDNITLPPYLLHPLIEQSLRQSQSLNGKSFITINLMANIKEIRLNISFAQPSNPAFSKLNAKGFQMVAKRLNLLFAGRYSLTEIKKNKTREIELVVMLT